jgi:putative phosphoesterase
MVKVGILSDTHLDRLTDNFKSVVETVFSDADMIIHAGDMTGIEVYEYLSKWNLKAVSGNMDSQELRAILPEKRIEEIEGRQIGIIHGRGSPYGLEMFVYNQFRGMDIVIFGHSHVPLHTIRGETIMFNPGSLRKPHNPPGTVGIIEISDENVVFRYIEVK